MKSTQAKPKLAFFPLSRSSPLSLSLASALVGLSALGSLRPVLAQTGLRLEKALPLVGNEILQPSGLAMIQGTLYLVSGKHDDQVFSVTVGSDKAEFKEALRIQRPADAATLKFLWRDLAGDDKGQLLLLSETAYRVLRLDNAGKGEWMGPSVLDAGTEIGLFGGDHSGPDGLASLGKNRFMIGASREPRGLISLTLQGEKAEVRPLKCEKSSVAAQAGRKADFTDLDFSGNTLLALVGSADAICALNRTPEGPVEEGQCWSYAATAQDPQYRFKGPKGIGRGLASDAERFYVVLDNKGLGREADPKDNRPLLLVFKRPNG